jgi:hypothetical protein
MFRQIMHRLHGKQTLLFRQLLRFDPAAAAVVDKAGTRVGIAHHSYHVSGSPALAPATPHSAANLNRNNHALRGAENPRLAAQGMSLEDIERSERRRPPFPTTRFPQQNTLS